MYQTVTSPLSSDTADLDVSVIVPTYNEAENLPILLLRLRNVLSPFAYEIIVVDDDSPDRTWEVATSESATFSQIKIIRRMHERGLSSAVLAGMASAKGQVLAVIDADLQHDEAALPRIIQPILDGDVDLALGSREAEGGSYGEWSRWRRFVSWGGKQMARRLLGIPVSDPMSGFFGISRQHFEEVVHQVNPKGFKILLEFLARGQRPRTIEVGYKFRQRLHGATKLTGSVVGAYLLGLLDLVVGRVVSATFTAYALVGSLGLIVRFSLATTFAAAGFSYAAWLAIEFSIISNYWLNNSFTFASSRRRGKYYWSGLALFHLVAAHGLVVQAGVAVIGGLGSQAGPASGSTLLSSNPLLVFAGVLLATAGNFILNRSITWRRRS